MKRRPCYGLPPGAPCPTHKDGTWPWACDCYRQGDASMRGDPPRDVIAPVAIVFTAAFVAVGIIWFVGGM
jgi:hypothetical protein